MSDTQQFYEEHFLPFRDSNQLHIIRLANKNETSSDITEDSDDVFSPSRDETKVFICLLNIKGEITIVDHVERLCLLNLLPEKYKSNDKLNLELVCADVSEEDSTETLAFLVVFWVALNSHCVPQRYFGSLFRISQKGYNVELCSMIDISAPVAYCRLADRRVYTHNQHCIIVFPAEMEVKAYIVDSTTSTVQPIEDVFSMFPELSLSVLPGSATRSSCTSFDNLRWSLAGFDSGHAILSVSTIDNNSIVDRKPLKFSGPISVLLFLNDPVTETRGSKRRLLVSSTFGPVAIWEYELDVDSRLSWRCEFLLENSQCYDSVTCACVQGSHIIVGTYSGRALIYKRYVTGSEHIRMSGDDIQRLTLQKWIHVNAPILSVKCHSEGTLCVLSSAGLHTFQCPPDVPIVQEKMERPLALSR